MQKNGIICPRNWRGGYRRKKGIKAEEYHEFEQFEDPEQIEFVDEDSLDLDSDDYEIINEEENEDDLSTTDLLANEKDE